MLGIPEDSLSNFPTTGYYHAASSTRKSETQKPRRVPMDTTRAAYNRENPCGTSCTHLIRARSFDPLCRTFPVKARIEKADEERHVVVLPQDRDFRYYQVHTARGSHHILQDVSIFRSVRNHVVLRSRPHSHLSCSSTVGVLPKQITTNGMWSLWRARYAPTTGQLFATPSFA